MDIAVKWIYQQVTARGGKTEAGQKPTLCFRGREHMVCVSAGHPVRVLKRPAADFDRMRDVRTDNGELYPVSRAVVTLRALAEQNGVTVAAKKLLDRAAEGIATVEDEDEFENEEEITVWTKDDEQAGDTGTENKGETTGAAKPKTADTPNESAQGASNDKETTVKAKTKKTKSKSAPVKAKAKAPAKSKAAPAAKKTKAPAGDTPFRAGTMKEKAFKRFKAEVKKFDELERGGRKEWCEKLAKELGASPSTVLSWVNGPFRKALSK